MRIVWRRRALSDLAELRGWIAKDSPKAAKAVVSRIRKVIADTAFAPRLWPMISNGVHRRIVVPRTRYVVYYRVEDDRIIVDFIMHAHQDRPT